MEIFFKFQEHVKDRKHCQEWTDEVKDTLEDIDMFQKNHPKALEKILEMTLHENECWLWTCDKCAKRAQIFKAQVSDIYM